MPNPPRKWSRRLGRGFLCLLILVCLLATFSLTGLDEAADRSFLRAVDEWQVNPEFRSIAMDYSTRGSEATRTHVMHVPTRRVVIAMRSLPFLPREYAVNATSRQHYEDFSRGPLSAYLHLCSEQNVHDMSGLFAEAGRKTGRTPADLRHVLDGYKMDFPVVTDQGALQSVADVLRDTDAARGFPIQEDVGPRLMAPIAALANELHFPANPDEMTADQQRAIFARLDSFVHEQDEELWRTKQLNDFCSGIWAQVYGPPYRKAVVPVLMFHDVGEILLILSLALLALSGLRKRPAPAPETDPTN